MGSSSSPVEQPPLEVLPWLKTLPVAPEYHPTLAEFQDPIAYIHKIEKEAAQYGICKIVPPIPAAPKKTVIANLNRSFAVLQRNSFGSGDGSSPPKKGAPTFTTRQQQIGFCPRRQRPAQKPVWQSGEQYTLQQFENKAKQFERAHIKRTCGGANSARKSGSGVNSGGHLTPLEVETLFWKACADKPFSVEYANDMPGSGFNPLPAGKKWRDGEVGNVGETSWNMRGVSRAKGSLLKFMKEDIPGVTSPMVYVAMLFSWFAWHVEDHDLHSLNYLHTGAGKTWYGVPRDAGLAFEDVIRLHGYGGEVNSLVTFETLGEKTTVMSPEVFMEVGIPCCRLVQNAGDFVVTFPGSYHTGFSLGFNCGEAANIATAEWLKVAKEAAVRRASINYPPMVSHYQLLYEFALSLSSRDPTNNSLEPRSYRLKDRMKSEGEQTIKELFVENVMETNKRIMNLLKKGSSCVVLPHNAFDVSQMKAKPTRLGFCKQEGGRARAPRIMASSEIVLERDSGLRYLSDFCLMEGRFPPLEDGGELEVTRKKEIALRSDGLHDQGLLSCVSCGILSFSCVAIIQPTDASAKHLMSADCTSLFDLHVGSACEAANFGNSTGEDHDSLAHQEAKKEQASALDLLVSTYADDSSDAEDDRLTSDGIHPASEQDHVDSSVVSAEKNSADDRGDARNPIVPTQFRNFDVSLPWVPKCSKESSRSHVFCLEHAVDVEKRLQMMGGSHLVLVCHPDYPKIEEEAKSMAAEMGMEGCSWGEIQFREASVEDRERICAAIEDEEGVPANGDWAVKLGINLFYSANLCKSPLYCQQLPYNPVIYKAFGRNASGGFPGSNLKMQGKRRRKQKRINVAGKWCGKVWMSNQVHPFLAYKNEALEEDEDEEEEEEDEHAAVPAERKGDNHKRKGKSSSKRKKNKSISAKNKENNETPTPKVSPVEAAPPPSAEMFYSVRQRQRSERRRRPVSRPSQEQEPANRPSPARTEEAPPAKKAKRQAASSGDEGDYPCHMEGCSMSFRSKQELALHRRNICPAKGCGKKFFSHKYLVHHQRVHLDERPLKCPWKGCKMTFKWAWARTEHIRVHTGARPYVCKEPGCGQTFRFVSDFSRHKRKTGHVSKKSKKAD